MVAEDRHLLVIAVVVTVVEVVIVVVIVAAVIEVVVIVVVIAAVAAADLVCPATQNTEVVLILPNYVCSLVFTRLLFSIA